MNFTLNDIKRQFDQKGYSLGLIYAQKNRVIQIRLSGNLIRSEVRETATQSYHQNIFIKSTTEGIQFQGTCSCPLVLNCHHVAATLLTIQQQNEKRLRDKTAQAATPLSNWVQKLFNVVRPDSPEALSAREPDGISLQKLVFILSPDQSNKRLFLHTCLGKYRSTGELAASSLLADPAAALIEKPDFLGAADDVPLRLFLSLRLEDAKLAGHAAEPRGKLGAQLLAMLLEQKRLFWTNALQDIARGLVFPLVACPPRKAVLCWEKEENTARLHWKFASPVSKTRRGSTSIDYILPTDPAWYLVNLECGELILPDESSRYTISQLQEQLAAAPPIAVRDMKHISRFLLEKGLEDTIPLPVALKETVVDDVIPLPSLYLGCKLVAVSETEAPVWVDYAQFKFDYDDMTAYYGSNLPIVRSLEGNAIERIVRDSASEEAMFDILAGYGFHPVKDCASPLYALPGVLEMKSPSEWLHFSQNQLAELEELGWEIEKSADYRYNLQAIQKWYVSINEDSEKLGKDWFTLELGIVVNKKHYPLFPVLQPIIQKYPEYFDFQHASQNPDSDALLATLADKNRVALPWKQIGPIIRILGELRYMDRPRTALPMHRLDSARLAELEQAISLQWIGGEALLEMGRRLLSFNGVRMVTPPTSLKATLRDYQLEGLSWMQFLREYDLAGILADDMGLGKTLQTLAHILQEKEAGRLTSPALIVAPTSLMSNWQDEAARFAPGLRVLVLQGKQRARHFDEINSHDIVLTTYALLPRDEEVLLEHEFHLLILDESQYIKNVRSKATLTASGLKARHRLCLTGTPLENHLGELWSQFHFLLPGLLGSERAFNSEFRHAIERSGDAGRRELLNRRLKPFLLRRTKDKVAPELPEKTEMTRYVELTAPQRRFYESMREMLDRQVQEEIRKLGIGQCQLMILDAILKLRQICCDPRLLKNNPLKNQPAVAAKLVELMEMLDALLLEDRHILIFSQFASMLALVETELKARDIPYELLTGNTKDRASAIRNFQEGRVSVFLISLKAGGVGLNLTAADTVIHFDPWWNPAVENQATDRAWRIGQDKPVFVYKLIARNTLEEKIQELQQKKSDLAYALFEPGQNTHLNITAEDIKAIFSPMDQEEPEEGHAES